MKATDIIKRDHRHIETLLTHFREANNEERGKMEHRVFENLDTHETMEDNYFYPELAEVLKNDSTFTDLNREQTILKAELAAIRILPMGRAEAFEKSIDKILNHATREESELFPKVEMFLGEAKLEELGEAMEPKSAVACDEEKTL